MRQLQINGENAEQMLKNNSKENDELRDLVAQIGDKNLYVLEMFNTLNKKFILLENQTTTLRSHFKCFTNKIGNMIAKLNSFQVQQENSKEEMVIDLKDEQQNIKKLAQKINEEYNTVNLNRKVFELEKEIEFYHMNENALRGALKKCQTQNEKLQIINDSLHTQLNCESRNCTKANENYLKAEALVKHLEEKARSNQNEIKDLTEKARAIEKELKEERLNCSKVKETLEFHEKKFYELKMSSEKNQQALDLARMQIKEKEEHHEELKRQLVNLNQEKEQSILKQIQLTNNINDVTIQLEYSRQEIGQQKLREKLIQEQNQRLENEKTELQKRNESITDELLSLKERLNQQADEIKQKQDEVESLKEIIDLKNIESSKSSRKVVSPN
ncbi:putative progesterone-induced-blocking factor [Schistosoma mansoni]|uniref:putative progesterone-induced-blocking factor n=1 Tax=Schistosoma mansoni TaxID=6183 RepID=UPI0001A644F2|nr:putative progesterone-induced-blocking factor [Schistosoma mansoni]|eukprot:XP_018654329.1 putative progesterone-induced-blocking factor [Schistosoma mansoni]